MKMCLIKSIDRENSFFLKYKFHAIQKANTDFFLHRKFFNSIIQTKRGIFMVTRLSEVLLQFLSNSLSKLEVTGVWADVQIIIKIFLMTFQKIVTNILKHFLRTKKFFFSSLVQFFWYPNY